MRKLSLAVVGAIVLLQLTTAHAYIGPGVAAGTLAIVIGILSSIFLAFLGILWFPIKRILKRRRNFKRTIIASRKKELDAGSSGQQ